MAEETIAGGFCYIDDGGRVVNTLMLFFIYLSAKYIYFNFVIDRKTNMIENLSATDSDKNFVGTPITT